MNFLMGLVEATGSDEEKSQIRIMRSYIELSENLHKIIEYGFLRDDLAESDRRDVSKFLQQLNSSVQDFSGAHHI